MKTNNPDSFLSEITNYLVKRAVEDCLIELDVEGDLKGGKNDF